MKRILFYVWALIAVVLLAWGFVLHRLSPEYAQMSELKTNEYFNLLDLCESQEATVEQVQEFIDLGVDIDTRNEVGETPLMFAVKRSLEQSLSRNPEVVKLLIRAGADVNAKNNMGDTPLMVAVTVTTLPQYSSLFLDNSRGNQEINPLAVSLLLKSGAHVGNKKGGGLTPLMLAAAGSPNPKVISILLKAGANAKAIDSEGNNALDYAKNNQFLKGTIALQQLIDESK